MGGLPEPLGAQKVWSRGADGPKTGSYGAMAARWISDPKVGGSNPSSFTPIFWPIFFCNRQSKQKKKCTAETGNRTQAAAATTRSPATRLFRRNCIWRIRVSIPVLNLAKVVCYHVQQSPMCVHRDSNPNLILGRDKYYPCTMDARIV